MDGPTPYPSDRRHEPFEPRHQALGLVHGELSLVKIDLILAVLGMPELGAIGLIGYCRFEFLEGGWDGPTLLSLEL